MYSEHIGSMYVDTYLQHIDMVDFFKLNSDKYQT